MRRCRFACVGALLLALLLTGCGKAGTAPEDGGADFSETEQVETPEAADALTVKEIAQVMQLSSPRISQIHAKAIRKLQDYMKQYLQGVEM